MRRSPTSRGCRRRRWRRCGARLAARCWSVPGRRLRSSARCRTAMSLRSSVRCGGWSWRGCWTAPSRQRAVVLAMVAQRLLEPGSQLACARALSRSTLGEELGVDGADEDELYAALDWLGERQERIEQRLARRHLHDGELALYDLSSSYFEGRTCPLAALGYSRDHRRGSLQIVYGLVTDGAGRPVAVDVFDGATQDHQTVPAALEKLKGRFGLSEVVLVADRGMVTRANLDAIREAKGVEWITALKAPQVKRLARSGMVQPSLFDQHNLAEITAEEFPGERLVVCRNPL